MKKIVVFLVVMLIACAEPMEPQLTIDPDGDSGSSIPLSTGGTVVKGYVESTDDVDFFSFQISGETHALVTLSAPDNFNLTLVLHDSAVRPIDSMSTNADAHLRWNRKLPHAGSYFLRVSSPDHDYSPYAAYRLSLTIGDSATISGGIHLLAGNPTEAAMSSDSVDNFLVIKDQYIISYSKLRGGPNWVAWHLNGDWRGDIQRQDDFRGDTTLPSGWYRVTASDFSESGFDRGHLCPSADRTATRFDNSSTFLMSNMIPQRPDNNQGPWADFENYCRQLASDKADLFIVAGGYDSIGTLAGGHVVIPGRIWKAAMVVERGSGLNNLSPTTRMIAVDLPNVNGIRNKNWKQYRVSVDHIENQARLDLFSKIPEPLQSSLEAKVDDL